MKQEEKIDDGKAITEKMLAEQMEKEAVKEKRADEIIIEETREEARTREDTEKRLAAWVPKTELGKKVLAGKYKNIDEILDSGQKIMEAEIVDLLVPGLRVDLLDIGQAKGKFGGGKRRPYKQTQKKTEDGNTPSFSVMAVVGNGNGYFGIGTGKAKENLPAKEKSIRKAKLNLQKVKRGCGSYDCSCQEEHSIPMKVFGKCSSVRVELMPAPQGTGLVAGDQLKKILRLAGIKDIYTKTYGYVRSTMNTAKACIEALDKLNDVKLGTKGE
jgi:small subunit ribosomal protein S5